MKIIFLDIDGVLNHEKFYVARWNTGKKLDYDNDYPICEFCPKSVKNLNEITDVTGAKIVLSSTWRLGRDIDEIKALFKIVGITGECIGKTPFLQYQKEELFPKLGSVERGVEINAWLEVKGFAQITYCPEEFQKYIDASGIENYIILDDDADMMYRQRNHFIQIDRSVGLSNRYKSIAIRKLNKTATELNYGKNNYNRWRTL